MHFISESYTFKEAVFMLLTEPIVMTAGTFALIMITLFTAHHLYSKPDLSILKTWVVSIFLGFVSGILVSLIFALAAASLINLDKGYYEATGTIEKIEYQSEFAGQTNGDYTISLKLDNGDSVDIQMPLQSPESIEPGDDFTLQSETLFNRNKVENFTPIEFLSYSPSRQTLAGNQFLSHRFAVDFIVDGEVVKGIPN